MPGSSANLGPGFDSLGLALGLYDDVEVSVAPHGVTVEVTGEGAGPGALRRARTSSSARCAPPGTSPATRPPGIAMRCRNAIPHSRGLGSSAAAAVAGAVAAVVLAGRDPELERDTLLQVTAGMEGHADNAAASLLGGFVVAWETAPGIPRSGSTLYGSTRTATSVRWRSSREPSRSTSTTRGLLPDRVPLADAAFTGSRTALAVLAFTQRPELLMPATEDRLHQGYRRPAYPESADLVDALRAHGVPAAISGAGPTVLALTADGAGARPASTCTASPPLPLPVDAAGVASRSA